MLVIQKIFVYECLPRLFIDDLNEFRLLPVDWRQGGVGEGDDGARLL